jgi:hypothetical protein
MKMRAIDHLRGQIIQSSTVSFSFRFTMGEVRPPKISQLEDIIPTNEDILRFDVPVNDVQPMNIL